MKFDDLIGVLHFAGSVPLLVSLGELTAVYARPKPNIFDATFGFSPLPHPIPYIEWSFNDWRF